MNLYGRVWRGIGLGVGCLYLVGVLGSLPIAARANQESRDILQYSNSEGEVLRLLDERGACGITTAFGGLDLSEAGLRTVLANTTDRERFELVLLLRRMAETQKMNEGLRLETVKWVHRGHGAVLRASAERPQVEHGVSVESRGLLSGRDPQWTTEDARHYPGSRAMLSVLEGGVQVGVVYVVERVPWLNAVLRRALREVDYGAPIGAAVHKWGAEAGRMVGGLTFGTREFWHPAFWGRQGRPLESREAMGLSPSENWSRFGRKTYEPLLVRKGLGTTDIFSENIVWVDNDYYRDARELQAAFGPGHVGELLFLHGTDEWESDSYDFMEGRGESDEIVDIEYGGVDFRSTGDDTRGMFDSETGELLGTEWTVLP